MRFYNEPVYWWGGRWQPSSPMSIVELIQAGNMSARMAALLWIGMERGASIIVALSPQASGKTTTLTALLEFLPSSAGVYFTRGIGETFDLPPIGESWPIYILINEISNHLPVYTWGGYARRAFELVGQGYSLGSTMHADTPEEVVQVLYEGLGIPPSQIANLTLIVTMYLFMDRGKLVRRVGEVSFQRPSADGRVEMLSVASWEPAKDTFHVLELAEQVQPLVEWFGIDAIDLLGALSKRQALLEGLVSKGDGDVAKVRAAIATFYKEHGHLNT